MCSSSLKAWELGRSDEVDLASVDDGDASLWRMATSVVDESNLAFTLFAGESGWSKDVVSRLLEGVFFKGHGGTFEVRDVYVLVSFMIDSCGDCIGYVLICFSFSQTVGISPAELIPTLDGKPIAFKKVDHAVVLSFFQNEMRPTYDAIRKRHPLLSLCQSEDPELTRFVQFAAVEVKSPDGSYYGASVQLAVWMAAGLQRMSELREMARSNEIESESEASADGDRTSIPPYIGIAVTGHVWNLHLAGKDQDGTVVFPFFVFLFFVFLFASLHSNGHPSLNRN